MISALTSAASGMATQSKRLDAVAQAIATSGQSTRSDGDGVAFAPGDGGPDELAARAQRMTQGGVVAGAYDQTLDEASGIEAAGVAYDPIYQMVELIEATNSFALNLAVYQQAAQMMRLRYDDVGAD